MIPYSKIGDVWPMGQTKYLYKVLSLLINRMNQNYGIWSFPLNQERVADNFKIIPIS